MVTHLKSFFLKASCLVAITFLAASCASTPPQPNPKQTQSYKAVYVNPFAPGTHEHFVASQKYPKTYEVWKNIDLLAKTNASNSSIIVDLSLQRARLYNDGKLAMDYPISTGNRSFPTPTGSYKVLGKTTDGKRSNLYGKIYDAEGNVVNSNANARTDEIPEGGKFEGAAMPYWMRLTNDGIGMHRGVVPRYPASHGCIRTPGSVVTIVYSKVGDGTPVTVQN